MSSIRPELVFSDDRDQKSFYQKYLKLSIKPQRTIRVADKGDYYTVFDQDAELIAELIYKTQSIIKTASVINPNDTSNKTTIQYLTLSPAVFSNLLKIAIFDLGYKFEIYDKAWNTMRSASPGNLSEIDELLSASDVTSASIIAAIKLISSASEGKKIGLSFYDPNNKYLGLSEFQDTDLYSNTESILIQLGIKECLIPETQTGDPEYQKLQQTIDRCDIVITPHKSADFNTRNVEQDLITLTDNQHILSTPELSSLTIALSTSTALLSYLSLLSDDSNRGSITVGKYNLEQYMKLDYAAVRALNLFPMPGATNSLNKASSVFGLLNNCKSAGGSRLLSQWIKQPLIDVLEIGKRQKLTEWLLNNSGIVGELQSDFLNDVPDIARILKKLNGKKGSKGGKLDDVVRLYQLVEKLADAVDILIRAKEEETDDAIKDLVQEWWLIPLQEHLETLNTYSAMVKQTIDTESLLEATSAKAGGMGLIAINPEYDETLMELSIKIDKVKTAMRDVHQETADELGMEVDKKLKLEDHNVHGWCFRLTRIDSSCIRGKKKFRELSTVKAGVHFTTCELTELCDEFRKLTEDYENYQSGIVNEIISIAATYSPVFTKLSISLSSLDVIVSFAFTCSMAPIEYTKPEKVCGINDEERIISLKDARHPCLEQQENMSFIANDYNLAKGSKEFLIITGPNMGGKSTYIRTLGVICLINQIGCFLPVSSGSEISIVDSILARVGASDSQLKGVSTFMSEMLEMSSILQTATSNSLIIVDELGRGTSTYDGFGLAWSISDYIANKIRAFTLFATHFHEMTNLIGQVNTIENLHVVAHVEKDNAGKDDVASDENITLLYKVEPGISDQSFGIHVAELVKFPEKIIAMSKRKAKELDDEKHISDDGLNKLAKYSRDDIVSSRQLLKSILQKWKKNVEEKGGLEKLNSTEISDELKKLVGGEFKEKYESNRALQETLTL